MRIFKIIESFLMALAWFAFFIAIIWLAWGCNPTIQYNKTHKAQYR